MRQILSVPIAAAAFLAMGCEAAVQSLVTSTNVVEGSGNAATLEPPVEEFSEVEIRGAIQATVEIGPAPQVVIEGDDNIVPLIRVAVSNGRLTIQPQPNTSFREVIPLEVTVTATSLTTASASGATTLTIASVEAERFLLEVSGASTATVENLTSSELELSAHGASTITVAGTSESVRIDGSGASNIMASGLTVRSAWVELAGATSGEVRVEEAIEGNVSGASSLNVLGNPGRTAIEESGAASVSYAGSP